MIQTISAFQKSSNNLSPNIKKAIIGLFVFMLILLLWNYQQGYDQSLDWEVTTSAEVISFPAKTIDNGFIEHEIMGEKYLLQERYSGSEISRNLRIDQLYLGLIWLGLCITLATSTYFNRYFFFATIAAFALMINRLNLFEVGLFGIQSKMVLLIPFLALAIPLIYFHEYRKQTPFAARIVSLILISVMLTFGIDNSELFTDHFIAHSVFSFALCAILFLVIVAEELIYGILHVVTSGKGGSGNHIHFIALSLIYLGNLILYYLNKSRIFENSFFFFDPFILLVVTCLVSIWSLQYKKKPVEGFMPDGYLPIASMGLGIVTAGFLLFSMQRGVDTVYQSFHYFILYFHIGFGAFFLLYIIANFIDPLIKGLEVHKIVYRERNFPYITARIGGIVCTCGFYFLSGQEAYNLLRSGYYSYLSAKENNSGNTMLGEQYLQHASFLGYNTHYSNYNQGWLEWNKGNEFRSQTHFFKAAQRFPSPYTFVNYGNIDSELNPNKIQAIYEEALRKINSPEMENNLGIIRLDKGEVEAALGYFEGLEATNEWNQAPVINKWNVYKKMEAYDSAALLADYSKGNFGVKANILTTIDNPDPLDFNYESLANSATLHRHAYLLNSSYLFTHDSISPLLGRAADKIIEANPSNRLAKARALHCYAKGEVNLAFTILNELGANAHQYYKGEYFDALGKLALEQGAYQLSIEFFDQALEVKHEASRLSRLEPLVALGRMNEFTNELLKIIKKDPGLTNYANELLDKAQTYTASSPNYNPAILESLSDEGLLIVGRRNAFNESLILEVVDELEQRGASGGYEMMVEAIEINPYAAPLLARYSFMALDWNLIEYADQAVERLKPLLSGSDFEEFLAEYEKRKEENAKEEW